MLGSIFYERKNRYVAKCESRKLCNGGKLRGSRKRERQCSQVEAEESDEQHLHYSFVEEEVVKFQSRRTEVSSIHHTRYFTRKHRTLCGNGEQNDEYLFFTRGK